MSSQELQKVHMTKDELPKIKELINEIENIQIEIDGLSYNESMVSDSVKGSSPSFPFTEHSIKICGIQIKTYESRLKRLKDRKNYKTQLLMQMIDNANEYIDSIPDPIIRVILSLRHINCLTWPEITERIGGKNTKETIRKMHSNFMRKN